MRKGKGDRMVDWIWRLCNMAFESGVVGVGDSGTDGVECTTVERW